MIRKIMVAVVGAVAMIVLAIVAALFIQGKRESDTSGQYVALGSSFAAGIGLGQRAPGSPLVCMRTIGGYPSILARKLDLSLVDMSCSGSTTAHILKGGQMFLGPQLDAIGPSTRLVTITSGGNDVGYIGDLMFASGSGGFVGKIFAGKAKPIEARAFDQVTENLVEIVRQARRRAPQAKIAIVSYPMVAPDGASCGILGIDSAAANLSREVGRRLAEATRVAAERSGAILVDMDSLSAGHDACSSDPWINGAAPQRGTPFHPNAAGAEAVASTVYSALSKPDQSGGP